MSTVVVVAPHPDDETLGCAGTILKHIQNGDKVYWLLVTSVHENHGFPSDVVQRREKEIEQVKEMYGFTGIRRLDLPTTKLDQLALGDLIEQFNKVLLDVKAEILYLPFKGDVHSDHKVVFDSVIACTKSFRNPFASRILCYETLSETNFGLNPLEQEFRPNVFIDISLYYEKKLEIMKIYRSELEDHPFPRSEKAIKALALLRGSMARCEYAEGFYLLKEIL